MVAEQGVPAESALDGDREPDQADPAQASPLNQLAEPGQQGCAHRLNNLDSRQIDPELGGAGTPFRSALQGLDLAPIEATRQGELTDVQRRWREVVGHAGSLAGSRHGPPMSRYRSGNGYPGKRQRMVVPTPTSLSAVTVPPWASIRCLTMASPSPVPPASRDRAGSTR